MTCVIRPFQEPSLAALSLRKSGVDDFADGGKLNTLSLNDDDDGVDVCACRGASFAAERCSGAAT